MPLHVLRHAATPAPPEVWELVTPRTNATPISAVARLLAASAGAEPFRLELVGAAARRAFLVRAGPTALRRLTAQLAAAYPQAELRPLDPARPPGGDPAVVGEGEQVAACALVLRAPP